MGQKDSIGQAGFTGLMGSFSPTARHGPGLRPLKVGGNRYAV